MEKIKYHITDIPKDVDKRVQLLVLLGEVNCSRGRVKFYMSRDVISYSEDDGYEGYYFGFDAQKYHTVITYDEFMNKYKPKVNKDGEKTLEQIIEDSIKEALYWDSLDREIDSFSKDDSGKIMPSLIEPEFNNWDKPINDANETSSNEDCQVGGTHYQKAIQPIEYIEKNKLGFCEGNVVKYVTRHKDKNGAEDIKKAIQYLEFILKYQYGV